MSAGGGFLETRRRPRWWLIALVILAHLAAFYGLVRVFAPEAIASVEREVLATFNVTVTAPPPPPPTPSEPDEGAAGEAGKRAVPKPVTAPRPRLPVAEPSPRPRTSSTGSASTSGARDQGDGTGAAGIGTGTGSGRGGAGQGGGIAVKAVQVAGNITDADADLFPVPAGGRASRYGQEVTIRFTIGTDGRISNCRIARPSNDPAADRVVCRLALERFRFRPARDSAGNPVPSEYGWRQRFYERN